MFARIATVSMSALAAVALAGCSFSASANYTVSPDELATQAAEALVTETNSSITPSIDCGDEQIDVVKDNSIRCELTAEGLEGVYGTTITITDVEGTNYHIDIQVDETPLS